MALIVGLLVVYKKEGIHNHFFALGHKVMGSFGVSFSPNSPSTAQSPAIWVYMVEGPYGSR